MTTDRNNFRTVAGLWPLYCEPTEPKIGEDAHHDEEFEAAAQLVEDIDDLETQVRNDLKIVANSSEKDFRAHMCGEIMRAVKAVRKMSFEQGRTAAAKRNK